MPEPADASRGASRRSPGMMVAMSPLTDLVAATQGLYAGAPSDFVAHRDALAKQLRASGDRALAAAVKGLRRPSLGAWYLNVASHDGLTSLQEWLQPDSRTAASPAAARRAGIPMSPRVGGSGIVLPRAGIVRVPRR